MPEPTLREELTPEQRAAREELAKAIQGECQAMLDTFGQEMLKALAEACKPIMDKMVKAMSAAAQVPKYGQKFEALKAHINQQNAAIAEKDKVIQQFLAQTKEGRLAALKAQQAKLAQIIAAEEAPPSPPPEDKPAEPEQPPNEEA